MRKQVFYMCEKCNRGYGTPQEALQCEKVHDLANKILGVQKSNSNKLLTQLTDSNWRKYIEYH